MNNETTSPLAGKKIGFGITASFCTSLDILEPLQHLKNLGAEIFPVVSENVNTHSSRFHERDSYLAKISEICEKEIIDTIAKAEAFGPSTQMDIMIVAPATGNTIAKLANGISDGAVTLAAKATLRNNKPVLLALFSNDALGMNGVNIMKLYNTKNFYFVPFGQDDPAKKPTSMTADLARMIEAAEFALEGKQIQPALIGR
ncbi:MAG: dipicolinate synthase subunit B [Defluviitaleaceae bacterium]|nr:dipicolinate synthase subunit B [Defluviitaleaceae bacterium]